MSSTKTEQVPGSAPEDYGMVDPQGITAQTEQNLYGQNYENALQQGNAASSAWLANSNDPNSFMNQYLGDFGNLTSAVTDATAPLSQQLNEQLQRNVQQGTTEIGQQMSGLGGLRSSGMANLAGEFAGQEAAQAGTALANAQLGLLSPLANQQLAGQQNAYGTMMNMPTQWAQMQASFGQPTYAAPQYMQTPTTWGQIQDAFAWSQDPGEFL